MTDKTNPKHYKLDLPPNAESIDYIEAVLGREQFIGFLRGNALKYLTRMGQKEGESELDDSRKIQWYVNRLVKTLEKG